MELWELAAREGIRDTVARYNHAGDAGRFDAMVECFTPDGRLAIVGMRSPALDLAWRMPGFRRRMGKRLPVDEWLFPNINTGCVVKFNEKGEVLESYWDIKSVNHPMITSMREHRGHLYLGGILNNRIGRYKLANADPNFVQYDVRWGKSA